MRNISLIILLAVTACNTSPEGNLVYQSETLEVRKIAAGTYVHITFLELPDYGSVPCNGLIFTDAGEAAVFDTPSENEVSAELIDWIESALNAKVKAVVANHFHDDCLGGIREFHRRSIPSYASQATIDLAKNGDLGIPENGFEMLQELTIGNKNVINRFMGEAHTRDNIISYIPSANVLFGGCMIKALGAGRGNLNDANINTWSGTVQSIKDAYPKLEHVVPGHGRVGGTELLDFTAEMFKND
ncbi:MAG: subclass B1 metallo-beta-lactamase [Roseivirga sp.]|nr:subclass B1 metallo-beta-lactamase [Roseivirga sp.]